MRLAFDRGTLLVLDAPDPIASGLPGVLWDPRVRAWRAPAFRYRDIRRVLRARRVPHVGPRVASTSGPWEPIDLRGYQQAALGAWEAAGRRGTIVLPTGAGKTRVGIAAMARVGLPALCIVPTRVLLHQWVDTLRPVLRAEVGCLGDDRRDVRAVTVATHRSAWLRMGELGGRFSLLVVDEAHHFGHGAQDEALEMCAAPFRLGLTATPPPDSIVGDRLADLIGPVVYRLSVNDLAGSYLADYEERTIYVSLAADERRAYEREMGVFRPVYHAFTLGAGDPRTAWPDFTRAAMRSDEGRRALAAWRRARRLLAYPRGKERALGALLDRHREQRVLVFTADNATAYAVARRFLIMPITCDIGRSERDEALASFREGTLRALVSSQVLNEGLDVPDADVGIVVGGRMGEREHVQRIGRVLRPSEGKRALVYELVVDESSEVGTARRRRQGLAAT